MQTQINASTRYLFISCPKLIPFELLDITPCYTRACKGNWQTPEPEFETLNPKPIQEFNTKCFMNTKLTRIFVSVNSPQINKKTISSSKPPTAWIFQE